MQCLQSKQLFIKNDLLRLHLTLFLVHFNNFEVICFQSLKVSKSYQNNEETSIETLLGVPTSFSLYCQRLSTSAKLWERTLTTARYAHAFYCYSYSENAIQQLVRPSANILDIVQYIVLHPLRSTKVFLIKLFKNFEEQVEDFFNATSDSLVKNRPSSLNVYQIH